jgi:hypothetical protein
MASPGGSGGGMASSGGSGSGSGIVREGERERLGGSSRR